MSQIAKTAWLGEFLELSRWYRRNASIRHGHPEVPPVERGTQLSEVQAAQEETTSTIPAWVKAALATAALGSAAGLGMWLGSDEKQERPPAAESTESESSLYQYLQDEGFHRP